MARKIFLFIALLLVSATSHAQFSNEYTELAKKGDSLYEAKQYRLAANAFTIAFAVNGGNGMWSDHYNAACSWALAGNVDSAFAQLMIVAKKKFSDVTHLLNDADLERLHTDKRWNELCDLVKQNKEKAEANLNKPLVAILDTIFHNDQDGRMKLMEVQKNQGNDSKEMQELWKTINEKDSIDLIKVETILDKYGWLGPDVVGYLGSETIFLVIQHSDIQVQDKYLPMMREAVKNKKAQPSSLALLEDRVALRHGRKQIYGSQIHGDPDGHPWISPLEDPDNVDKRRAEVGLGPLADYVKQWDIKWDPAEYKKQLPEIEKKDKL